MKEAKAHEPSEPKDLQARDAIIELALCEQNFLVLHPGALYRLTPREGCTECTRLANIYAGVS